MSDALRQEFSLSAYSLAGRTCENMLANGCLRSGTQPNMPVALVFEAGDRGYGKLQDDCKRERMHSSDLPPQERCLTEGRTIEPGLCPCKLRIGWLGKSIVPYRLFMKANWSRRRDALAHAGISQASWYMGVYTPENIQDMEANIDL